MTCPAGRKRARNAALGVAFLAVLLLALVAFRPTVVSFGMVVAVVALSLCRALATFGVLLVLAFCSAKAPADASSGSEDELPAFTVACSTIIDVSANEEELTAAPRSPVLPQTILPRVRPRICAKSALLAVPDPLLCLPRIYTSLLFF